MEHEIDVRNWYAKPPEASQLISLIIVPALAASDAGRLAANTAELHP